MEYITFVSALLLSLAQTCMGFLLLRVFSDKFSARGSFTPERDAVLLPVYWIVGLLMHLSLVLVLKIFACPWWLAVIAPLGMIALCRKDISRFFDVIVAATRRALNIPFLLWLCLQFFVGASLFTMRDGISTPWVNNYGDLAFHLGMIANFTARGDFPADYHLYAGEQLSYPFFVNLWAAALWWPFKTFATLKVIFLFQWVALWTCVYTLLVKRNSIYLPWLLFFGGGSYFALIERPEVYSWQLISEGYPWTTWLSTVWVTQRSALFGLAAAVAAACAVLNTFGLPDEDTRRWRMATGGILLGLMPLVHTHYFVFTALFLGFYLLIASMKNALLVGFSWSAFVKELMRSELHILVGFSLLALVFFPLLLSKSGMTSVMLGWTVPHKSPGVESLASSAVMWIKNAPQWFFVAIVLVLMTRKFLLFAVVLVLFLLANTIKLASWEWDQLKVFLVVFTMMAVIWRFYLQSAEDSVSRIVGFYTLALLLMGPGLFEAWRIFRESPSYQVYDPSKLELAELVSREVPYDSVIASPDDHNSAATLSGRTIFFGYPGTLASHNINYQSREAIQKSLENIRFCEKKLVEAPSECPDFVIWDGAASNYWGLAMPGEGYTRVVSSTDKRQSVYRVLRQGVSD